MKKDVNVALERLAKWRSVFAGWQLGTRASDDPECQAVRDHRELSLILRAEMSALTSVLIDKGVFTQEEFENALAEEADLLEMNLEMRFPGFRASSVGMEIDVKKAVETTKGWKP